MDAAYVFAVRFRLDPDRGVAVDPATFETRLRRPDDDPGEARWPFFRDNFWRGDLADPTVDHLDVTSFGDLLSAETPANST